jgi:hypothetical protein
MKLSTMLKEASIFGDASAETDLKKEKLGPNRGQYFQKLNIGRVTRGDYRNLNKSDDLNQLTNTIDTGFKTIMLAANNTPLAQFVASQLNQVKTRLATRIEQEKIKQEKSAA